MREGAVLMEFRVSESIGGRIRALRAKAGWSLSELAARAGVSKSYVGRLEKGDYQNPSGPQLSKIAGVLGVSVSYLLGQDQPLGIEEYPVDLLPLYDEIADLWRTDPEAARDLEQIIRLYIQQDKRRRQIDDPPQIAVG